MPDADAPLGEPAFKFSESLLPQAEAASEGALRPWSGVSGLRRRAVRALALLPLQACQ